MRYASTNLIVICLLFAGCVTRQHTYQAPDATKMNAARQRLSTDVERASVSAKKAQGQVNNASVSTAKIIKLSGTISVKLVTIHDKVPAELKPAIEDIQADLAAEKDEQALLTDMLTQATATQRTLEGELLQAQTDKAQLSAESQAYADKAGQLAQNATDENTARIKAEKALSWYRWHSLFLKIAAGVAILAIIFVIFLWVTGRLAGLAAKL